MLLLLSLSIITFSFNTQLVEAPEVTLHPTDDAYTVLYDDANHGDEPYLDIKNASSSTGYLYYAWTWLKFDTTTIPTNAVVTNATLKLHGSLNTGIEGEKYNVSIHSCSNVSWSENLITWTNQPAYNYTSESWTIIHAISWTNPQREWFQWDATTIVKNTLLSGQGNLTIVMDTNETHPAYVGGSLQKIQFVSKEQMGWWPYLKITYMLPDTSPPIISDIEIQPSEPLSDDRVTVTASVVDSETGVEEVNLYYSTDGSATWNKVTMDIVGSTCTATIPQQDVDTRVQYYLEALDTSMNKATSVERSYQVRTQSAYGPLSPEMYLLIGGIIALIFASGLGAFLILRKRKNPSLPKSHDARASGEPEQ